jgi:hypothetical protein
MPGANVSLSAYPRLLRSCAVHFRVVCCNRRSTMIRRCHAQRAPLPSARGVVALQQATHIRIAAACKPQAACCYTYTCGLL